MPDSDSLYHRLFSHPRMVEELVREFVPEALAEDLDFQGLQSVNPKFHTGRRSARRRESDVIWRLPTRRGADVYRSSCRCPPQSRSLSHADGGVRLEGDCVGQ